MHPTRTVEFCISRDLLAGVARHAADAYPEECCGLLVGSRLDDRIHVVRIRPGRNCHSGDRRRRYEIDPQFAFDVFRQAQADGAAVVGFYHSHPDGTDAPSQTDRDESWPDMVYLIVGVGNGGSTRARAWWFGPNGGVVESSVRVADWPACSGTGIIHA